ncbi:MAG: TatD family hydrolase [Acidobacteriia bacterium]|nr:TatD family hydrolase [Terriglobia bacterium]
MNSQTTRLVDTHAHLCDPVFDTDRTEVLDRAREVGMAAVIAVGEDLKDAEKNIELATAHSMIRPAAGLYPTHLSLERAEEMRRFIRTHADRLIAIGEVGLDYWAVQEETQRELQREILAGFILLARELSLPLNVHSRSAGRHAVAFLLRHEAARVQLHAFDGNSAAALPAVEAGFFFSIPPSIVRSEQKKKLVRRLPLDCLLVETDSPVLGPKPQERNEPANALLSIQAIAEIKGVSRAEVAEAVSENTRRLYGDLVLTPA